MDLQQEILISLRRKLERQKDAQLITEAHIRIIMEEKAPPKK